LIPLQGAESVVPMRSAERIASASVLLLGDPAT
jgi:hypothetical protein